MPSSMLSTSFAGNRGRESPMKKLPIARASGFLTTSALPRKRSGSSDEYSLLAAESLRQQGREVDDQTHAPAELLGEERGRHSPQSVI
jgi:hypothetical protein